MSKTTARKKARSLLVQALYQWQMSGTDVQAIEVEFFTDNDMGKVDVDMFREVLHGVPAHLDAIENSFRPLLDREHKDLDPISLSILRLGCYELLYCIDVPYKVAINEAVSLAKKFGATDSYKYINGILDQVAEQSRVIEVRAHRKKA